ncbi:MAG: NAD(+)/NADH kinase [Deltaproteobacteria bacterium]|nr:NAD(+)/NADH kinase [Deltaproteobacteria bacterium]
MSFVGIIANPASGKDIRRLVAYGSVFDNQEKVRIVRRVILGLLAVGVERICYMPDYFGIVPRALDPLKIKIPVFPVDFRTMATQDDSTEAGRIMAESGVDCIVTLGGDGTNRAVIKGGVSAPVLPISTGTNNVFPSMVEGTLAGLAAGLVANKLVPLEEASIHSTMLQVWKEGQPVDVALVDAGVYDDQFIGSRAIWDMDKVRQIFLNRAEPFSIGLSAIGGLIQSVKAEEPYGLCLTMGPNGREVLAPVAPGMIKNIALSSVETMTLDQDWPIIIKPSILALDGEREVEVNKGQQASVRIIKNGPKVVDVAMTMTSALKNGALVQNTSIPSVVS